MKARHIIGIVVLALAVLAIGPMVMGAGVQFEEAPLSAGWFALLAFAVPAGFLTLVGALIVGPGYRLQSAAWTLIAGSGYAGLLLVTILPMMSSPEWQEMMTALQARQDGPAANFSVAPGRPASLIGLLVTLGVAGLLLARRNRPESGGDTLFPATHHGVHGLQGRPLSVTLISLFLVVLAGVGLLGWVSNYGFDSEALAVVEDVYGEQDGWKAWSGPMVMLVWLVCGMFLWLGANWARWLLVGSLLLATMYGVFSSQTGWLLPVRLVWLAVFGYFLFYREPARRWFGSQENPSDPTFKA
ncbi:MAG: hypothetical protein V2I57_11775 [Xanthomonadales bacterium]|nr:hypothetical protein [Xanthomonadales bacterium]